MGLGLTLGGLLGTLILSLGFPIFPLDKEVLNPVSFFKLLLNVFNSLVVIFPLLAFSNNLFVPDVAFIISALIIGTLFPSINVTAIVFCFFIISPGAKVISGSFVIAPTGLNLPDFFNWNCNNLFASPLVNVFPVLSFVSIPFNAFGNFSTFTFSKIKTCGFCVLNVTSPLRISDKLASFCATPNLEGLNLPFGSAKKDLSRSDPALPVSILILWSNFINSFFPILPASNFFNRLFVVLDNFASPGIGFLTILVLFVNLTSLSACAETGVTLLPASLTCSFNGIANFFTGPPILIFIVLPFTWEGTVIILPLIPLNLGDNFVATFPPTFPTTLKAFPVPFKSNISVPTFTMASVGLTLIRWPTSLTSSTKAPGISGIDLIDSTGCVTNCFIPKVKPISDVPAVNRANFASLSIEGFSVLINSLAFPTRATISGLTRATSPSPFFVISFNIFSFCFFNFGVCPFFFISEINLSALSVKVNSLIGNFNLGLNFMGLSGNGSLLGGLLGILILTLGFTFSLILASICALSSTCLACCCVMPETRVTLPPLLLI